MNWLVVGVAVLGACWLVALLISELVYRARQRRLRRQEQAWLEEWQRSFRELRLGEDQDGPE